MKNHRKNILTSIDYHSGSIVNFISSIKKAFKLSSLYPGLKLLDDNYNLENKSIINILIDGLGYEFLRNKENSFLAAHCRGSFHSVFPTTTACALTSYATGLTPLEHGITGWFMKLKGNQDHNCIVLTEQIRGEEISFQEAGIDIDKIYNQPTITSQIPNSICLIPREFKQSLFSYYSTTGAEKIYYDSMEDFFNKLLEISSQKERKYLYAYFPLFDTYFHEFGSQSLELNKLFEFLDHSFKNFFSNKFPNSFFTITSDHGLLDCDHAKNIDLDDYPKLKEMLNFSLCGEPRTVYFYVKEKYQAIFKEKIKSILGEEVGEIYTKSEILAKGIYGTRLDLIHPDFENRIGDFVFLLNEDYIMRDFLKNEPKKFHLGNHGGLADQELLIPLIVFDYN